MSQKRKYTERLGEGNNGQDSKKRRPNFKAGGPRRKSNRPQPAQEELHANSINSLKSRIRNLRRLLEHVDNDPKNKMPANVRVERERELETCEHELSEKQAEQREAMFRKKIIGKYHHIRFFERQKATRTVKRLHKQLSSSEDQSGRDDLLLSIHNAEVDVNYTIYYPLLKPYVSLFPRSEKDKSAESIDGPKGNVEIWKAVEKATEQGTLEKLRESKDGVSIPRPKGSLAQVSKGKKAKEDPRLLRGNEDAKGIISQEEEEEEEEEDSDGGFFE